MKTFSNAICRRSGLFGILAHRSPRKNLGALLLLGALLSSSRASSAQAAAALPGDHAASLSFSGNPSAVLFSKEIAASFQGALQKDFVSVAANGQPAGFVNASPAGQAWSGTMWSRDGGTFLRELTMWGDYQHATLLAHCLIQLVDRNKQGFYAFPRYFRGDKKDSGTELDGTGAIVIGMELLWERLPANDPTRNEIQSFLLSDASPVAYFRSMLKQQPLLPGTGEFGCGMGVSGACDNVVQNNLVRLALLAASRMEKRAGRADLAAQDASLAEHLRSSMEKYLVSPDGAWIWAVDTATLQPDSSVLTAKANLGFGGANGVASMTADVLGLQPLVTEPDVMEHSEKTFQQLYNVPLRKQQFDRYGIWTQFDTFAGGVLTSPSYGQGYALQTMLLTDHLQMADKALGWLANATYQPIPEYHVTRSSPYFFYERFYSPLAPGKIKLDQGCGALNLVNVTEPLKVARLILGVDDSDPKTTVLVPRLPPSWTKMEAHNWPILTDHGVIRANITFSRSGQGAILSIATNGTEKFPRLRIRMPSSTGYVWRKLTPDVGATIKTN